MTRLYPYARKVDTTCVEHTFLKLCAAGLVVSSTSSSVALTLREMARTRHALLSKVTRLWLQSAGYNASCPFIIQHYNALVVDIAQLILHSTLNLHVRNVRKVVYSPQRPPSCRQSIADATEGGVVGETHHEEASVGASRSL